MLPPWGLSPSFAIGAARQSLVGEVAIRYPPSTNLRARPHWLSEAKRAKGLIENCQKTP